MALDLGLILGSALAGAAAGGGEAAQTSLASAQDAQQKQDLVKMQSDLDEQKQMRILEAQQSFEGQQQQNLFQQQQTLQGNQQDFEGDQGDLNRANTLQISAANNATSVQVAGIGAAASRYASDARIAADKEMAELSRRGSSLFTAGDGKVYNMTNSLNGPPTVTPIMDPTDPSKPLIGAKNLDQSSVLLAQSLMTQSKAAETNGDDKAAAQLAQQAQTILQGGATTKTPSAAAISLLKSAPTPAAMKNFDSTFGAGASASILGGQAPVAPPAAPSNATSTGTPGTMPMPGGGDPGAGTNNPALINGNLPPPQAAAVQGVPVTSGQFGQSGNLPAAPPVNPSPSPTQPSALIASAMTPQQGPPPTQQAFPTQLDAFGRPVQPTVQSQLGL